VVPYDGANFTAGVAWQTCAPEDLHCGPARGHQAAGSLRMPYRTASNPRFESNSVVDQDLKVSGVDRLYICDMSVMPFSSAANRYAPWCSGASAIEKARLTCEVPEH
jgi:choline dehydrogenase-like flavoprotein